jgi:hypothetical protein
LKKTQEGFAGDSGIAGLPSVAALIILGGYQKIPEER